MITKKQWKRFVYRVYELWYKDIDVKIFNEGVIEVDTNRMVIYTSSYLKDTEGRYKRTEYSHEQSVRNSLTLPRLYDMIKIQMTLEDLHKKITYFKKWC